MGLLFSSCSSFIAPDDNETLWIVSELGSKLFRDGRLSIKTSDCYFPNHPIYRIDIYKYSLLNSHEDNVAGVGFSSKERRDGYIHHMVHRFDVLDNTRMDVHSVFIELKLYLTDTVNPTH